MDHNREFVRVLADLKFICSVKKGEIMYIANRTVAPRTIFSTLYRKYYLKGESGQDTAEFITKTLTHTYRLLEKFRSMESCEKYMQHLIEHITDVRAAIDELKCTYDGHSFIIASFEAIQIDIDHALDSLKI